MTILNQAIQLAKISLNYSSEYMDKIVKPFWASYYPLSENADTLAQKIVDHALSHAGEEDLDDYYCNYQQGLWDAQIAHPILMPKSRIC